MAANLNNDDLRQAFNELGNILARLQPQASAQMLAAHPDPREIATLVFQVIVGLRVLFPASDTEPSFEPIGAIAERVVAPLRDQFNATKLD